MKKYLLLMVLVLALAAIGCRFGQPVGTYAYDFPAAEARKNITEKQMHDAIVKACADTGWRATDVAPNTIEATIMVRNKHTVVVSIPYTATHYSINYKASTNMEYKAKSDGSAYIHPNYNNWVSRLDKAVRQNVASSEY
ncbi:MAG: hypothetical protein EOM56_10195 [Deltaproteobacteria bacterium]|nr:hypothetical protein [Deltaproteobacteria bacterium]